ncbi:AAA family ATPase [Modicisalibacter sp. MOD 31.J]|uniref:AAA family ATPase n=1 Tax=Modicisalibacter sp. MOD 31.J TaxID=2831897 RepID=UPI001CCF2928|nr:AAA family ATPase [Modicisalibacter sp. MOD 31.J]
MQFDIGETFGIEEAKGAVINGHEDTGSPFVPKAINGYIHRRELLSDIIAWLKTGEGEGLLLVGPTGCGKTSGLTQVFAGLNWPTQRLTAHRRLEMADFTGHYTVIDGDMVFVDGPLVSAMRYGHAFLLDEMDMLDPGVGASLNTVVEEGMVVIPENGGEVVRAAPGFKFIATANTAGNGDRTGLYQATLRQNAAFLDRFWVVEVDYPTVEQEAPILASAAPSVPDWVRGKMIEVAGELRGLFIGELDGPQIELPMSTRSLARWARLTSTFQGVRKSGKDPVLHALDRAFLNRAQPETREAVHGIVARVIGDDVNFK